MTAALIAKLESASEGSLWTDHEANELIDALGRDRCGGAPAGIALAYVALNGSIDAALALAERMYPDWDWIVGRTNGGLTIHCQFGGKDYVFANTPALAICAALLRTSASEGAGE